MPEVGGRAIKIKSCKNWLALEQEGWATLLLYLAASGVGTLGIIDDDKIELSNLHQQILYQDKDIGRSKAECAAENYHHVKVLSHSSHKIKAGERSEILSQYDIGGLFR